MLSFGISLWQGIVAGLIGAIASFLLVGLTAIAGKRGSAPTLTLSRAPYGVRGNVVPGIVSYLLLVGWETALVAIARSELWAVVGILVTNVSVTPFLVHLGQLPGVAGRTGETAATWSPEVLTLLAIEAAWVVVALALALWLPTLKRDFV